MQLGATISLPVYCLSNYAVLDLSLCISALEVCYMNKESFFITRQLSGKKLGLKSPIWINSVTYIKHSYLEDITCRALNQKSLTVQLTKLSDFSKIRIREIEQRHRTDKLICLPNFLQNRDSLS